MSKFRSLAAFVVCLALASVSASAGEPASGWRGNGTGLWPTARPPITWHRTAHGATEGLRACADRPAATDAGEAPLVEKGLLGDWLVLGPFPVADSVQDLDNDPLGAEADIEPSSGDKTADRVWQPATVPPDDPMVFGTAELPWLDLAKVVGFQRNQLAYAHTYCRSTV